MDNKISRHQVREQAFLILFQKMHNDDDLEQIVALDKEDFELEPNADAEEIVKGVEEKQSELDEIIQKFSPKRSVTRIASINLIIMRISIYEMLYVESVPDKVAIDEAIEISKAYAYKPDSSFINGVLNAFYLEKNGEKVE